MKIDIHTHTKKCKSGDAPTREITPEEFCRIIEATEVGIIAITNHNVFDLTQYEEIKCGIKDDTQVWLGIELDVVSNGQRGHLLVIVSPEQAIALSGVIANLTNGSTPDNFTIDIDRVSSNLDSLNPIYVAHYKQKTPNLSDEDLETLAASINNSKRVIKEVTNSISAGIYISHGYASIYGSDHHDWSKYETLSRRLPDLRLPVESFEHFCLLLEKDPTTINTTLDKKVAERLTLIPFEDNTTITIKAFNDINVIFGSKGTGKSCILKSIAKQYSDNGLEASVYESASDKLDAIFDIKGRDLSLDLKPLGIDYCKAEIERLRSSSEVSITSLSKYVAFFRQESTNKNAKKLKLKDIEPEEESSSKHLFVDLNKATKKAADFLDFINNEPVVSKCLVPCDSIEQRVWRLRMARDSMKQLYQQLGA